MRRHLATFLALVTLAPYLLGANVPVANSGWDRLPHMELYGREFVDLPAWAEAHHLSLEWDKRTGDLRLTNRWSRLAFVIDSRRAEINGVRVWLSIPITPHNLSVCIAATDLQTVLQPLLDPPQNKPSQKIHTVAIDPGHGGRDPGNLAGREQEKVHTLILARKIKAMLEEAGLRAVLTRTTDQFIDLPVRNAIAKKSDADLFVSLHYNAAEHTHGGVKGVEVYCLTPPGVQSTNSRGDDTPTPSNPGNGFNSKNILLAYELQASLVKNLEVEDRGVRRARFVVLKNPEMPAVLVEGGFMTDPAEAKSIFDDAHKEEFARAVVDGILAYKRLVER